MRLTLGGFGIWVIINVVGKCNDKDGLPQNVKPLKNNLQSFSFLDCFQFAKASFVSIG